MREDLIDFPVSDTWRDYYYEMGMTTHPSPRYWSSRNVETEQLKQLKKEIARLSAVLEKILKQISQTDSTLLPRMPKRRAKPWPVVDTGSNKLPENI